MKGIVKVGKQEARKYGTPTANIYTSEELDLGIFMGHFVFKNDLYKSCIYVSKEGELTKVEAYAIDRENLDLYNEEIEVHISDKIRDIRRFDSFDELKLQILRDVEACRN
jgi:riboflavin kinase/FMN adenylyltransferase